MVFSEALCAANLASAVLANGMCCLYQIRREEVQKKEQEATIRQTIYSEWERHRQVDRIEREKETEKFTAILQDERRAHLMVAKRASENFGNKDASKRQGDRRDPPQTPSPTVSISCEKHQFNSSGTYSSPMPQQGCLKFDGPKKNIFSGEKSSFHVYKSSPVQKDQPERPLSSLMDECDEEFEEVCIE
jgi:hypothetical protein